MIDEKKILVVWNLDLNPLSIGGLLILFVEIQIQQIKNNIKSVELCIIGRGLGTYKSYVINNYFLLEIEKTIDLHLIERFKFLSIISDFSNLSKIHLVENLSGFFTQFSEFQNQFIFWPSIKEISKLEKICPSTKLAQRFYGKNHFIPTIVCHGDSLHWAEKFLLNFVYPAKPVIVHLKNNTSERKCSNANFDAWYGFLKYFSNDNKYKFVLIGNEPVDDKIVSLPNVIISRDYGSNLPRDLALITQGSFFLGMSSGPCNVAIFSKIPYVIYKNPDHDVEQMNEELGEKNSFVFSTSSQKFSRSFETTEMIIQDFQEILLMNISPEKNFFIKNMDL